MEFPTWVEIDLDAVEANIRATKEWIGAGKKILFVVKADAYGHGALELSRVASKYGVAMLGVATLHEGVELREGGISVPILLLSPSLPSEIDQLVHYRLRPSISTFEFAEKLSRTAKESGKTVPVHIEVDTGMGRSGVDFDCADDFIRKVAQLPSIAVEGVFTHFPDVTPGSMPQSGVQLKEFVALTDSLERAGIKIPCRHAANSAGILGLTDSHLDMIRPGLMIYGRYPWPELSKQVKLQPVMSFRTRTVQLRRLPAGRSVSYGRAFVTKRETVVAVVAAGYGHGYSWLLSGRGNVLVRGMRAPVIGNVTMDLTMVDVTGVPNASEGDEVVLFGRQGKEEITIEEVAAWSDSIVYEIMCSIGKRVVRVFLRDRVPKKVLTLVGERSGVKSLTQKRKADS
ncbi:MAG: alanine racemase [Candidatus Eisenbacteria bacterium]|nr:alanine racemase [Candidatus Eisenbacteria bacterium]